MDLAIEGDAALVTASSRGLGRASARALAREGANVVVNGRDADRVTRTATELDEAEPGRVVGVAGDLTDPDAPAALVEATVDEFGGLDHLVTSAGGPPPGDFVATDDEDWYAAFDLLVMSAVRTVRAAAPHLRDGGGTYVAIASRSVKEAIDGLVLSNAVRSGVVGLAKTLSTELAPEVRTNVVLPGAHETDRVRDLVEAAVERGEHDGYEAGLAAKAADVPLGRVGDPRELGDVVAFLSSPRAGYVDGATLTVDGGASASTL